MTYLKMAVALIGAILLVVGVFEPILGVPVFHDQSLMSLRPNVAWTVLGLAALALLLFTVLAPRLRRPRFDDDLDDGDRGGDADQAAVGV